MQPRTTTIPNRAGTMYRSEPGTQHAEPPDPEKVSFDSEKFESISPYMLLYDIDRFAPEYRSMLTGVNQNVVDVAAAASLLLITESRHLISITRSLLFAIG